MTTGKNKLWKGMKVKPCCRRPEENFAAWMEESIMLRQGGSRKTQKVIRVVYVKKKKKNKHLG